MVPSSYDGYFSAAATAGAALIGLLFVAISLRDEAIFGPHAMPGGEALAITAFTGLVNSFVVSLLALIPRTNIGVAAVVMAVLSLGAIARLHNRLQTPRNNILLVVAVLAYGAQLIYGIILLAHPHDSGDIPNIAFIVFATLVVSLQRAWTLLKGKNIAGPR